MAKSCHAAALFELTVIGQLRERKALARSMRARQLATEQELACRRRHSVVEALSRELDHAVAEQFHSLQAGAPAPGLQQFIGAVQGQWRLQQSTLAEERDCLQASLAHARRAAQTVASAQERARVYADMLRNWQSAHQAQLDDQEEP